MHEVLILARRAFTLGSVYIQVSISPRSENQPWEWLMYVSVLETTFMTAGDKLTYRTACIQYLPPSRWRSHQGRRERPIRGFRMELHIYRVLRIHCLADHSWHWSAIQRSGSKKVRVGFAVPIPYDCGGVCLLFGEPSKKSFLLMTDSEPRSNGFSGDILWLMLVTRVLLSET